MLLSHGGGQRTSLSERIGNRTFKPALDSLPSFRGSEASIHDLGVGTDQDTVEEWMGKEDMLRNRGTHASLAPSRPPALSPSRPPRPQGQ